MSCQILDMAAIPRKVGLNAFSVKQAAAMEACRCLHRGHPSPIFGTFESLRVDIFIGVTDLYFRG